MKELVTMKIGKKVHKQLRIYVATNELLSNEEAIEKLLNKK